MIIEKKMPGVSDLRELLTGILFWNIIPTQFDESRFERWIEN